MGNSEDGDQRSGDSVVSRDLTLTLVALALHCQESYVQLPHTFKNFFSKKKYKYVFQVLLTVTHAGYAWYEQYCQT